MRLKQLHLRRGKPRRRVPVRASRSDPAVRGAGVPRTSHRRAPG